MTAALHAATKSSSKKNSNAAPSADADRRKYAIERLECQMLGVLKSTSQKCPKSSVVTVSAGTCSLIGTEARRTSRTRWVGFILLKIRGSWFIGPVLRIFHWQ